MTDPTKTKRVIHDPDLGKITVKPDYFEMRIVIEWDGYGFGLQYENESQLIARYVEITEEEILTIVQNAADEINGTQGRVIH